MNKLEFSKAPLMRDSRIFNKVTWIWEKECSEIERKYGLEAAGYGETKKSDINWRIQKAALKALGKI